MLNLQRVVKDDRLLSALTGFNLKALEKLKPAFAQALLEEQVVCWSNKPRQRKEEGDRKARLKTVEEKLIERL